MVRDEEGSQMGLQVDLNASVCMEEGRTAN